MEHTDKHQWNNHTRLNVLKISEGRTIYRTMTKIAIMREMKKKAMMKKKAKTAKTTRMRTITTETTTTTMWRTK